jgi:hypothetical protein
MESIPALKQFDDGVAEDESTNNDHDRNTCQIVVIDADFPSIPNDATTKPQQRQFSKG